MSQLGFKFNTNLCTGCAACEIACSIENELGHKISWRQVSSCEDNPIDEFHLSMACNHCHNPVCLEQCPANAITKNIVDGVVIIDSEKCIGCKYCSWVCPYDAPVYNAKKGSMQKCTFCNHRLEIDLEPACVSICPTGALNIGNLEPFELLHPIEWIDYSNLSPAIEIKKRNSEKAFPANYLKPYTEETLKEFRDLKKTSNKISLKNEWGLALFTFLVPVIGGFFSGIVFGKQEISPIILMLLGIFGITVSSIHLGQIKKSYRAVYNFRRSWLSREIVGYGIFMLLIFLNYLFPNNKILIALGLSSVLFTCFSIDMVYHVTAKLNQHKFHSAQTLLTFIFLACIINSITWGMVLLGVIKFYLYWDRKVIPNMTFKKQETTLLRITLGFFIPVYMIFYFPEIPIIYMFIIASIGELIDRFEFYNELEIATPFKLMHR